MDKKINQSLPAATRPLGATPLDSGAQFTVWAPEHKTMEVLFYQNNKRFSLKKEETYFTSLIKGIEPGMLYSFVIDDDIICPDLCSRFQPEGINGPSMIIDPNSFVWSDSDWAGLSIKGQVFYEIHVGTFSHNGTFEGIVPYLEPLKDLGITVLELMPIVEFPGKRNWGYDGIFLFAPSHIYGDYNSLKHLVNEAHKQQMAIVLDVVYNHVGPGNCFTEFSEYYFSSYYENEWGRAFNFDSKNSLPVREFFLQNAEYWIKEFHIDGFRFDATQGIFDKSNCHIISEIEARARQAAGKRKITLIAENEPQDTALIMPKEKGGTGLDALWIDDFHHTAKVLSTGKREAYYSDYIGSPQEFISLVKKSALYQGQYNPRQEKPRGSPTVDCPAYAFIFYLQNHDQIANSLYGKRLHEIIAPSLYRALTTVWLLSPQTPLFFMGQEFGARQQFLFFSDHDKSIAGLVDHGRKQFLSQFPSYQMKETQDFMKDPNKEIVFQNCFLNHNERDNKLVKLHKDLLLMRKQDPVFSSQNRLKIDGAVLCDEAFVLRYSNTQENDRLLVVNLGKQISLLPNTEPLLAPMQNSSWVHVFSSEDIKYGGEGKLNPLSENKWYIPGICANLFKGNPKKI